MTAALLLALLLAPVKAQPEGESFRAPSAATPDRETARAAGALREGKPERAIEEARRALAISERHVPAMLVLARAYLALGKLELSGAILDVAAAIEPKSAEVPFVRGFIALAEGEQTASIGHFRKATELDAKHALAWNALGAELVLTKNYAGARAALEAAVQLQPRLAKAHLNLGCALRGLKEYDKAEAALLRALALDATLADALYDLGILYLDADPFPGLEAVPRLEKAVDYLQRFRTRLGPRLAADDPAHTYLAEAQKSLDRQRKLLEKKKGKAGDKPPKAPEPKPAEPKPADKSGGLPAPPRG